MSEADTILVECEGPVTIVSINRPERKNALFSDFYLAIEQALLDAETDKSVRVVLLRGVADDFSAGNDMQDFAKGNLGSNWVDIGVVSGDGKLLY